MLVVPGFGRLAVVVASGTGAFVVVVGLGFRVVVFSGEGVVVVVVGVGVVVVVAISEISAQYAEFDTLGDTNL